MKTSVVASLLILVIAALIGGRDRMRLSAARETRQQLIEEADRLGITRGSPGVGGPSTARAGAARRDPATRQAAARDLAARVAQFVTEMDARQKAGGPIDEGMQERIFLLLDEMLRLDATQIKTLIGELRADALLTPEMRRNIVGLAIGMLANDHPSAALAVFAESSELFPESASAAGVVGDALSKWARTDPQAALAWVRENTVRFPEIINDSTKQGLIGGAAKHDPRLAFRLISELGVTDVNGAGNRIAGSARTAAERNAVLAALRDHVGSGAAGEHGDALFDSTMAGLAGKVAGEGFGPASEWLATAKLDERETEAFVQKLHPWQTREDTGKWVEWLGQVLPPDRLGSKVGPLMKQWAQDDFKAAAEWLNSTPAGLARDTALKSYASTVAAYQPAAAAQWALTLPPGSDRDDLLKSVHRFWRDKDPAAAAAFARQHRISE